MRLPATTTIAPILLALLSLVPSSTLAARSKAEKVLLSNVRTLTLRKDAKTSHNRVSALPQLNCIGGTAKGLYEIDTLRCKNAGGGYSDDDVQWTCTANLPSEFKLGSTDVICEGFAGPEDPYVLKGSCGVEYRLMLTEAGEEIFGRKGGSKGEKGDDWWEWEGDAKRSKSGSMVAVLFWIAFVGVVAWMLYAAFIRDAVPRRPRGGARGGFGGWGGGGSGGDDPPPPYDYNPPPSKPKASSSMRGARAAPQPAQGQQGWRPGFWTGALGGAAAGYAAGNRGGRTEPQQPRSQGMWGGGQQGYGNGEGSSRMGGRTSSSSTSSHGSSRHESSGFGGTTRR